MVFTIIMSFCQLVSLSSWQEDQIYHACQVCSSLAWLQSYVPIAFHSSKIFLWFAEVQVDEMTELQIFNVHEKNLDVRLNRIIYVTNK